MTTVSLLETARVSAEERARFRAMLPADELAAAERMSDAHLHICARAWVRASLTREAPEVPADAWTFERTEAGKPFVTAPSRAFEFSLSHTDGLVVVAVGGAGAGVGVDVESLARAPDILETVLRAFAPAELAALRTLPAAEQPRGAVELWTVKEAYLKGLGTGISRHLDRFAVAPEDLDQPRLRHERVWHVEEAPGWRVHTRVVGERWIVATAVAANETIAYRPA
ncbi:MAG: 4'-phosphopantetheinyl transferase superfamily protein [Labilithrix sp.]